jgi:hypothetical protein
MLTNISRIAPVVAALAVVSPAAAQVRDFNAAAENYGRGVHAYFAGRTAEAEELFSLALADSPNDPRILYYRAMALLRLGRAAEARGDMLAGAEIEAGQPGRYAVGTALSRVQGSDRLLLERFRQQARARAAEYKLPELDQTLENVPGVLRSRVMIPLDDVLRTGGPQPLTAEEIARRAAAIEANRSNEGAAVTVQPQTANPDADPFTTGGQAAAPAAAGPVAPPQETETTEAQPAVTTFEEEPAADAPPSEAAPAGSDEDPFGDLN